MMVLRIVPFALQGDLHNYIRKIMAEQHTKKDAPPGMVGVPMRRGPGSLMMGKPQKAKKVRGTLFRLWSYVQREKVRLSGVVLLVTVTTAVGVTGPYLMGLAIDGYMLKHDAAGLTRIALLMLGVYVLTAFTTWFQTYLMAAVAQRSVRNIRNDLFAKLQTLSLRFFDKHPHGELMSRLANDVENISHVLSQNRTATA